MTAIVAHADWSVSPDKRWCCIARWQATPGPGYSISAPQPVGKVADYFSRLAGMSADGSVLAGFDFPLGLPIAYARRAGVRNFARLLPQLGNGTWSAFYQLCSSADDINLHRPFYPARPGGTRHAQLCAALGVENIDALRRRCEKKTANRGAASPLFWTLGGQQVGRAAISGWRDLLQPALRETSTDLRLWPFDGDLEALAKPGSIVAAETYPAESGLHIGLPAPGRGWSKRKQADRAAHADTLFSWAKSRRINIDTGFMALISNGFGADADGEDQFDATIGVMGMLEVVLGHRKDLPALDDDVCRIEGWIFGQA